MPSRAIRTNPIDPSPTRTTPAAIRSEIAGNVSITYTPRFPEARGKEQHPEEREQRERSRGDPRPGIVRLLRFVKTIANAAGRKAVHGRRSAGVA